MEPASDTQKNSPPTEQAEGVLAFPASVEQQMFWYLEMLQGELGVSNIPLRFKLEGRLDVTLLERSINIIIDRHESLRTTFGEENGELLQFVSPLLELRLDTIDISHLPATRIEEEIQRLGSIESCRGFKLSTGPLIRAELIRTAADSHILHVSMHHAIFDGLSITVFSRELGQIYQALSEGKPIPLEPLPIQFGDYSVWQKDFLEGPEVKQQLTYWKKQLDGMVELDLPTEFNRPQAKSWKGEIISTLLPASLTDRLQAIAVRQGCTLFHLEFAAYMILLRRYSGMLDIAVGTPVTGRNRDELEPLIGVFINSLVLRCNLAGNPTFKDLVAQVNKTALDALENQDLPFECLVRELRPERDQSRNPLFQVAFNHHRSFVHTGTFGGVSLTSLPSIAPGTMFDLYFFMVGGEQGWRASCEFSYDLFSRQAAQRMLGHFVRLLEDIADHPDKRIEDFAILSENERKLLLEEWSGHRLAYPRDATIGSLFTETVNRFPEHCAIESGSTRFSYRQLYANATRIAALLIDAGVTTGDPVVISSPPGPEMIAGFAGILLAGGCCVPIDSSYPAERINMLLEECGATIALVAGDCGNSLPPTWQDRIYQIPVVSHSATQLDLPEVSVTANHPSHIMFTSGSSGRPKGVRLAHRGTVRLVRNNDFIRIDETNVFLQTAPASFDASLFEIWGALLNGGRLVLLPDGPSLESIATAVRNRGVTSLWLTSGLFHLMIDEHADSLKGLHSLISGGEVLSLAHIRKALAALPSTRVINAYGPTENTTFTTCHDIVLADLERSSVPIGVPIANTTVHILDEMMRPVPIGIPGELMTGGDGLAIDYLNAPELTSEKFIHHPEFGRLYRTGDRCRWNADGTIEFMGRSDLQVKVRGFRIELGEIEIALTEHPQVRICRATVRGNTAETKRIIVWVVPEENSNLSIPELAAYASARLPSFMRPDAISIISEFPLNANGKIDLKALPTPGQTELKSQVQHEDPLPGIESQLASIWSELLGVKTPGRHADFFSLGGHSLLALRMFSRINRELGRSLPLATLLKHPTIAGLASLMDEPPPSTAKPVAASQPIPVGHVVSLKDGNGAAPLFCIHGGDGGVIFYRGLADALPSNISVYAIESLELGKSGGIVQRSIKETAAAYLQIIRQTQKTGPYRIAGYSFGGVVAHELACQLAEMGEQVSFLGMFDTHNPAAACRAYSPLQRLRVFWQEHREEPVLNRIGLLRNRISEGILTNRSVKAEIKAATAIGPAEAYSDLRRVQVREENWRAMQEYQPRPFKGRITLFKSDHLDDKFEHLPDYGWSDMAQSGVEILSVSGNHLELFAAENVEALASTLNQALNR